jgi:hypothetical protein
VDTSIPVKEGCKEFVISHKGDLQDRLQTSSKFEINVLVSLLFSTCTYKKGESHDVPYQYCFECQRDQRTVRSPGGGEWRSHSVKTYVLVFFLFGRVDVRKGIPMMYPFFSE